MPNLPAGWSGGGCGRWPNHLGSHLHKPQTDSRARERSLCPRGEGGCRIGVSEWCWLTPCPVPRSVLEKARIPGVLQRLGPPGRRAKLLFASPCPDLRLGEQPRLYKGGGSLYKCQNLLNSQRLPKRTRLSNSVAKLLFFSSSSYFYLVFISVFFLVEIKNTYRECYPVNKCSVSIHPCVLDGIKQQHHRLLH